ncbi:MAG: tRNA uridine(34) 5-carboxymethylaminomethyl modification radical SAM/GNAT enzyme Elp3 [bacterium]
MNFNEVILKAIMSSGRVNPTVLASIKRRLAKEHNLPIPSNTTLLQSYHHLIETGRITVNSSLAKLLRIKSVRSLSGIVSVSVLTKPYPCPGKCIYCPTEFGLPKSYLTNEPAVSRAITYKYHPYHQAYSRLMTLDTIGHPIDKIELIIIGGTWSYLPKKYQGWFIKECFRATSDYLGRDNKNKQVRINRTTTTLKGEQARNETAINRVIGITVETRPDYIDIREIKWLRKLGVTRVELGVQTTDDKILKINRRGHEIKETINATRLLKDAGFKVCYHLMPNLPGATMKSDAKMLASVFSDERFRPDLLKIYPCVVLEEAPVLYRLWVNKKYHPYSDSKLTDLLIDFKKTIPYYCRIQRLIRDIPATNIIAGCKISNLRQVIKGKMIGEGFSCHCIRCREPQENVDKNTKILLFRDDYNASGGKEIFLSIESENREYIFSLLRLRIPSIVDKKHFIPTLTNTAIIREVHTYGQMIGLKKKPSLLSLQHQGMGLSLVKEAERIAKEEFKINKIAVISGIGAREYYRIKAGYYKDGDYMVKQL